MSSHPFQFLWVFPTTSWFSDRFLPSSIGCFLSFSAMISTTRDLHGFSSWVVLEVKGSDGLGTERGWPTSLSLRPSVSRTYYVGNPLARVVGPVSSYLLSTPVLLSYPISHYSCLESCKQVTYLLCFDQWFLSYLLPPFNWKRVDLNKTSSRKVWQDTVTSQITLIQSPRCL